MTGNEGHTDGETEDGKRAKKDEDIQQTTRQKLALTMSNTSIEKIKQNKWQRAQGHLEWSRARRAGTRCRAEASLGPAKDDRPQKSKNLTWQHVYGNDRQECQDLPAKGLAWGRKSVRCVCQIHKKTDDAPVAPWLSTKLFWRSIRMRSASASKKRDKDGCGYLRPFAVLSSHSGTFSRRPSPPFRLQSHWR